MAGTVMTVGIVALAGALAVGFAAAGSASVFSQKLATVADAAALAAADAASEAVSGASPCERAAELAATGAATVSACDVDGLIATVTVSATFLRFPVTAMARAGPPPSAEGEP